MTADTAPAHQDQIPRRRRWLWPVAAVGLATIALAAFTRVGMLDLPAPPSGLSLDESGLADLDGLKRIDDYIRGNNSPNTLQETETAEAARLVRKGLELIEQDDAARGLELMRDGARRAPRNLAMGNAYRMAVFDLQRKYLMSSHKSALLTPEFPPHLANQPVAFFEKLAGEINAREVRIQLALAWVDRMLLFPALEIKAPSSVEAVDLLTELIEGEGAGYVPALFARGMNHLHRPARLVWPESDKTPPDAAVRDIGLCVAIGREFGVGSDRLQANLAIALGDAYVKAGRLGVARSWWQIAQNLSNEADVKDAVRRRFGWSDEEALDRLEAELDRARSNLTDPMTDLAFMWN
jgi:hypothetical protein